MDLRTRKTRMVQTAKKKNYLKYGKELLEGGAYYNDAGSNWGIGQVKEKMLFIMLFSQYKEVKELEKKMRKKSCKNKQKNFELNQKVFSRPAIWF